MGNFTDKEPLKSCAIRKIKLKGELGKRFGKVHKLAVKTPGEAIRALCVLRPGFKQFLMESGKHGIDYRFLVKRHELSKDDLEEFNFSHSPSTEFCLIPVIRGSKRGGLFNIIIGVVLIAASWYAGGAAGWGYLGAQEMGAATMAFTMGASMVLSGVAQILTPTPKFDEPQERADHKPSYLFNGAVNTMQQGQPIPLLYGKLLVGSAVISAGLTDKEIPIK